MGATGIYRGCTIYKTPARCLSFKVFSALLIRWLRVRVSPGVPKKVQVGGDIPSDLLSFVKSALEHLWDIFSVGNSIF